MKQQSSFGWKIYFFFIVPLSIAGLYSLLAPSSIVYRYYHVLMSFDKNYAPLYYLDIASAAANLLVLIPLFLFVFHMKFLHPRLWQWVFVLKICLDFTGGSYELKFFQSLFYTDPRLAVLAILISLLVVFPCYIACFQYCFRQKKLFAEMNSCQAT